jgi:hypothetical protein
MDGTSAVFAGFHITESHRSISMTHDPYTNRDPLDPMNPREPGYGEFDSARGSTGWGWILGGLAALVLLFVFVFGFGGTGDQTASNTATPPAATGTATRPAPTPSENTGAAPRNVTPPSPAQQNTPPAKPAQ